MFAYTSAFNQPLNNWNVARGINFVSNNNNVQFDDIHLWAFVFKLDSETNPLPMNSQPIVISIIFLG
jgi:hypothetical protein